MSIEVFCQIVALILFILSGLNAPARGLGLGWFGLAFVVLSWLLPGALN